MKIDARSVARTLHEAALCDRDYQAKIQAVVTQHKLDANFDILVRGFTTAIDVERNLGQDRSVDDLIQLLAGSFLINLEQKKRPRLR